MKARIFDKNLEKFVDGLERETYSRTLRLIGLLKTFGNQLKMPYSKSLGSNLFELRARGKKEVRIFYTFSNNEAVLLHGFIKKTKKTPTKEIEIAISKLKTLRKN